jgi:hypothetical protein
MSLSAEDRARVEAMPFDPAATAAYDELTGGLAWADELPDGLSPAGHELLRDLLGVRAYLHRGLPLEASGPGAAARAALWQDARASGLRWNGFRRLELTAEQWAILDRYVEDDSEL